jgi:hypothetical protein
MNRTSAYWNGTIAGLSALGSIALAGYIVIASVGPCNNRGGLPWEVLWPTVPLSFGYASCAVLSFTKKPKRWPHFLIWAAILSFSVIVGEFPALLYPSVLGLPSLLIFPISYFSNR